MIAYIEGKIIEKNPAYLIVNCGGVGYQLQISLNTYSHLGDVDHCQLHAHLVVREDAQNLYGFYEKSEKVLFLHLISVNGVGATTAIMMLSSMSAAEIKQAIVQNNVAALQKVKGIGSKSAQRIIIDLRDKLTKEELSEYDLLPQHNTMKEEALSALVTLGFNKNVAEKAIDKIIAKSDADMNVESLVKMVLKSL